MGFRENRYGPVLITAVTGFLVRIGVRALRNSRTESTKSATASTVKQSAQRLDGTGEHFHRPHGVETEASENGGQVDYRCSGEHDHALVAGNCSVFRHLRLPATVFRLLVHASSGRATARLAVYYGQRSRCAGLLPARADADR